MIRVFSANDRDFSTNGDAVIKPIKSRVRNNINGEFSYELTCESKFYDYLKENKLLLVDTPQGVQPFRINNQVTRKGNRITVKARHVFYDASNLVIRDSYAVDLTCKQALEHFNDATDTQSPFIMDSNIEAVNSFRCVRKSLLEAINTVLERWGGYLVRNYWNVTINSNIGRDNGITIEYRKNLQELTASYDYNNVCTKALPVGKDGILLPELYVYSQIQYEIPYTKVISIDQGDINEDDYPTYEAYTEALIQDLRAQAQNYVNANCVPVVTYTLKGKPEVVSDIGDIIRVRDTRIGVDITTQVIGYEYDTITGSYASLTFGNFGTNLGDLMSSVKSTAVEVVNEAMGEVRGSISKIYELLQGSYVVYRGYDILVMDAIPMSVAQHVIRFSNYGISVSNDGVNGTYTEVYNIETQKLTVPSISLHGIDLETELNKKLESDDLIEGDGIKLTKAGGKVTIATSGGGALKWWVESKESLYRKVVNPIDNPHGWDCDPAFKWNYDGEHVAFIIAGTGGSDKFTVEVANNQRCYGIAFVNGVCNLLALASESDAQLEAIFSGRAQVDPLTYQGLTLYYSSELLANYSTYESIVWMASHPWIGTASGRHFPLVNGDFSSITDAIIGMIEQSHFCTRIVDYTGESIGDYSAWGGTAYTLKSAEEITPQNMPWYITKGGIYEGKDYRVNGESIDKVRDVQVKDDNGQSSVVANKVGVVDLTPYATKTALANKQDVLTAGTGIDITNNVISSDLTEANPSGEATNILEKLRVGNTIYNIPQGGGSRTDLFSIFDTTIISERYASGTLTSDSFSFSLNDYIYDWSTNATAFNNVAVDLTNYDTIEIGIDITEQADYGAFWVTFSDTKYTWGTSAWAGIYQQRDSAIKITESGTYSIDVSSLAGDYYIYIGGTTGKDSTTRGDCDNNKNGKIIGEVVSFYGVAGSSGGTDVEANPSGTPTDTLETVRIGQTIYDIEGGNGSAVEISYQAYQALSQSEKENGTQYYVPDAPDALTMPYLTLDNGVLTIVYDDGE